MAIERWLLGIVLLALLSFFPAHTAHAGERINHAGRILGPAPVVSTPTLFNTPEGDAIISAMQIFPRDNAWYEDVSTYARLGNSDAMIAKIKSDLAAKGANRQTLRVFTEMNYVFVPDNQAKIDVRYVDYPDESDDLKPGFDDIGSLPVPSNTPIETWPAGTGSLTLEQWQRDINGTGGDRHAIVVMPGAGYIWEMWQARLTTNTPNWESSNCAKFNLNSNALRPDGWTSADASGMAMFPALIRYDECARGEIEHALRLIVGASRNAYLYPASHRAGSTSDVNTPAMGQRLRLKSTFAIPTNWHPFAQAACRAMKKYGLLVTDNGGFFSVSCTPDQRFPSGCFSQLQTIDINNFEVVQGTGPTGGPRSPGAPTANAGPDLAATLAAGTTLNGAVTGSNLTTTWYAYPHVTQPGTVTFGSPNAAVTTASFSATGSYTLMLKTEDGVHTPAYDAVVVTVSSGSTDTTPPAVSITAPTSSSTHAVSSSPLNLGGTASDNIAVTQVTWTNDRGGSGTASGTTAWTVSNIALQSGANVLTVTARDAAGNTASDTLTVTYTPPPPPPPAAPSNLAASAVASTQVNLTWTDNSNNETNFRLERKTGASGTYAQIATPGANATAFQNNGLTANTTYFYRLRATNAAGNSAYSNEVSATTPTSPPPPPPPPPQLPAVPTSLTATALSSTSITLQWVDNSSNEIAFELERGSDGVIFAALPPLAANTTGTVDADLAEATGYYYRVRATNADGSSAYSNVAFAVTQSGSGGGGGGGGGGGTPPPPGQGPDDDFDADGQTNSSDPDDDNDGLSDAGELAAGTNPYDFFSGSALPMTVSKLAGSVKFETSGRDGCAISGVLPALPAGIDLTGRTLELNMGGAAVVFLLNSKGQGRSEKGSIALKLRPSKRNKTTKALEFLGGDVSFKARLSRGTWSDDWADEGVNPAADAKNQPVTFNVSLNLGGKIYSATVNAVYSGKAGKSGRMKF